MVAPGAGSLGQGTSQKRERTEEAMAPKYFFSSRRRHTTSKRDWSSDVCSSDLVMPVAPDPIPITAHPTKSVIGRMESLRLSLRLARRTPLAQRTLLAQGTLPARKSVV